MRIRLHPLCEYFIILKSRLLRMLFIRLSLLILFVLMVLFTEEAFSQTNNENKAVLNLGLDGSWDDQFVSNGSVIFDSSTSKFKMWYNGGDGEWSGSIGYATSPDSINWHKDENNPVLEVGLSGTWDDYFIATPSVILDDTTYHMWYAGVSDQSISHINIGYAVSSDGINWQKDENNPVLEVGPADSWEETWVYFPYVIYDGLAFHMWYTGTEGNSFSGWAERIGYATSPDGISWTKDANNPVLDLGSTGSWDDALLASCSIFFDDTTFNMWYTGGDGSENFKIGYATSPDGIIWSKYANNPVLSGGSSGSWDRPRVQDPRVIFIDSTYYMWYSGGGFFTWQIGYATSPDGVSWTKYGPPVLTDINDDIRGEIPIIHILSQNYPNPFNPSTTISYTVPRSGFVSLRVYDVLGRELQILVNEEQKAGDHSIHFNARDLAGGIYFYTLQAGSDFMQTRKMLLMR